MSCLLNLDGVINRIEEDSIILVQYPYPCNYRVIDFVIKKLTQKRIKIIVLIHDIDSLRYRKHPIGIQKEINYLNSFPYVISHNSSMTEWLLNHGLKSKVLDLELFDYNRSVVYKKAVGCIP